MLWQLQVGDEVLHRAGVTEVIASRLDLPSSFSSKATGTFYLESRPGRPG